MASSRESFSGHAAQRRPRLPRKGLPNFRARGRGSLFVRLTVQVPEKLSAEERELFERLREIRSRK